MKMVSLVLTRRISVHFVAIRFLAAEVIIISALVVQGTLGAWHIGLLPLLGALTVAWVGIELVIMLVGEVMGLYRQDQAGGVSTAQSVRNRRLPAVFGWVVALSTISTYAFTGSPLSTLGIAGICMILTGNLRLLMRTSVDGKHA